MNSIHKYPRTQHLQGSRLGPGDEDLEQIPLESLKGKFLVIEEKLDGANCAISFSEQGELLLQSRGHYLSGGPREAQFQLFKSWAHRFSGEFWEVLGARYVMYGEWLYAKHTVFYDQLPHYFHEFDILDRDEQRFLDTESRALLLEGLPVCSVPVLYKGSGDDFKNPGSLVTNSLYKSVDWKQNLREKALELGQSPDLVATQTDSSDLAEGLYLKVEANGLVTERFKWVRWDFLQSLVDSGSHWHDRPLLPNMLAPEVDIFRG